MNTIRTFIGIGVLAVVGWAVPYTLAQEDPPPEGMEVLARGPVHEAFATPSSDTQPEAGLTIEKQPPDPLDELPPEQKPAGDNVEWMPGYWHWDPDRSDFVWVSGFWRDAPPQRVWVPGGWHKVDGGWRWTSGYWAAANQPGVTYLPPPPESQETGPATEAPGEDYVYVPGCWYYRDSGYVWRAGYWLRCQPDWIWRPSYYVWTPAGCVFVSGYWDRLFAHRGLLFAPVWFSRDYYARRDFYWSPSYCIRPDFLTFALFVGRHHHHYYFGDYYDARYRNRYTPWMDVRVGRTGYDPTFGYYRATAENRRDWETRVRTVYAERAERRDSRPPQTLAQQNTFVRNRKNVETQNVLALAPLTQVARQQERTLRSVSTEERNRVRESTREMQNFAQQRVKSETNLLRDNRAPTRSGTAPRTVELPTRPKVDQPRTDRPPPKVDQPKPPPKVDQPKPPPKVDQPKPPPRSEPPKPQPKVDPPKPPPKADPPKPPPRVDPPKPPPKVEDRPKPAPRVDPPKPPPRSEPPKPPPPKPKVDQGKPPQVEQRRSAPAARIEPRQSAPSRPSAPRIEPRQSPPSRPSAPPAQPRQSSKPQGGGKPR